MVIVVEDTDPTVLGSLASTRILYPLPAAKPLGIVALMLREPVEVEVKVPIVNGDAKLPLASESFARYWFPLFTAPVAVKFTVMFALVLLQNELLPIAAVDKLTKFPC